MKAKTDDVEIKKQFEREAARVNLRKMLEAKTRGSHITASEIVTATGFQDWRSFGPTIRTWARSTGLTVAPVHDDGWKVGTAVEQIEFANNRRRRGMRQIKRGLDAAVATPAAQLSESETRKLEFETKALARQYAVASNDDKEIRKELKMGSERVPLRVLTNKNG